VMRARTTAARLARAEGQGHSTDAAQDPRSRTCRRATTPRPSPPVDRLRDRQEERTRHEARLTLTSSPPPPRSLSLSKGHHPKRSPPFDKLRDRMGIDPTPGERRVHAARRATGEAFGGVSRGSH
jgi:hypothetical protein